MSKKFPKYLPEVIPDRASSKMMPIKSPSPDRKRTNIITPTRTPELSSQWKQNFTPTKSNKRLRNYFTTGTDQYHTTPNDRIREDLVISPSQFTTNKKTMSNVMQSQMKFQCQYEQDYIKLLESKEDTIKELRTIIAMLDQQGQSSRMRQSHRELKKTFQLTGNLDEELKQKNRILTIENQKLVNIILSTKESTSKSRVDTQQLQEMHKLLTEKQGHITRLTETVRSHTETIRIQADSIQSQIKQIQNLQQQNEQLMKLLKERDGEEKRLMESQISQREKSSIVKIKQQYQQSIKTVQITLGAHIQQFEQQEREKYAQLEEKIRSQQEHLEVLQKLLKAYENSMKNQQTSRINASQMEIQSIMIQKSQHQKLQAENKQLIKTIQDLKFEITALEGWQHRYEELKQKQQQILQDNEREKESLVVKINSLQNSIRDEQANREESGTQIVYFKQLIGDKDRKMEEIQQFLSTKQQQIYKITTEFNQYKANRNESEESMRKYQIQITQLSEKLGYSLNKEHETEEKIKELVRNYQEQITILKQTIQSKDQQIMKHHQQSQRNQEIQSLRQQLYNKDLQLEELTKLINENQISYENNTKNLLQKLNMLEEQYKQKNSLIVEERNSILHQKQQAILNQNMIINTLRKQIDDKAMQYQHQLRQIQKQKQIQIQQQINIHQEEIRKIQLLHSEQIQVEIRKYESQQKGNLEAKWQQEKDDLKDHYGQQLRGLHIEINALKKRNENLQQSIIQKEQSVQRKQSLIPDLIKLKEQIIEYKNSKSTIHIELLEDINRISIELERKINEGKVLEQANLKLREDIHKETQQKIITEEKLKLLETNIKIYEKQLQERKKLCELLIKDKTNTEQELLGLRSKKIREENIQNSWKSQQQDIQNRINRLLELEGKIQQSNNLVRVSVREDSIGESHINILTDI